MAVQRRIETTRAAVPKDLSWLPDALVEHFANKGQCLSLDNSNETTVATNSLTERYPLLASDLPEDVDERAEILRELQRSGCRPNTDGTWRKGDCYIYVQSAAARKAMLDDGLLRWQQQNSDAKDAAKEVGTINDMIGNPDLGRAYAQTAGRLTDYVDHG